VRPRADYLLAVRTTSGRRREPQNTRSRWAGSFAAKRKNPNRPNCQQTGESILAWLSNRLVANSWQSRQKNP